jgi:uncharacterized protein (TIGR02611 family)
VNEQNKSNGPIGVVRRVVKGLLGGLVVILGVVMLVTPGPGIVAILIGLSILASEFPFARRLLNRLRRRAAEPEQ